MTNDSHRSLRDKLDIHPGMRLYFHDAPADILTELGDLDDDTSLTMDEEIANYFHYFITTKQQLSLLAGRVERLKEPHQIFWIS